MQSLWNKKWMSYMGYFNFQLFRYSLPNRLYVQETRNIGEGRCTQTG